MVCPTEWLGFRYVLERQDPRGYARERLSCDSLLLLMSRIELAARNNAVWCDTVCRAHGVPGEFLDGIWVNRNETPRFYPNAVTFSTEREPAGQLAHIRHLLDAGLPGEVAVKDSFCALDLGALGFRILFDAAWIWRSASPLAPGEHIPGVEWWRVTAAADLDDWEAACAGELAGGPRRFPASLLADERIAVVAGSENHRIVAGAIANRTGDVVGISNLFVPAHAPDAFRIGCVAGVVDAFPGLHLVSYEGDVELAGVPALQFEALGPLRVWVTP